MMIGALAELQLADARERAHALFGSANCFAAPVECVVRFTEFAQECLEPRLRGEIIYRDIPAVRFYVAIKVSAQEVLAFTKEIDPLTVGAVNSLEFVFLSRLGLKFPDSHINVIGVDHEDASSVCYIRAEPY